MSVVRPNIDRSSAALGLIVVWAANARYLAGFAEVFDPPMSMDPYYVELAKHPVAWILSRDPAWGPLYALWLKPLCGLLVDPLAVIARNVQILSFAVSTLIYGWMLMLTGRIGLAAMTALFFVTSALNVPLDSKICSFALALVLVGLVVAELFESRAARTAAVALGVLAASYARPELFPAGIVLWGVSCRHAWRDRERAVSRVLLGASAGIALVAVTVGTPIWRLGFEGDRLFDAFREHFAGNWVRWNGEGHPYLSIWEREFGAAGSVGEALLANPSAVVRHVVANVAGIAGFFAVGVFRHEPVVLPSAWPMSAAIEGGLLSAGFIVLAGVVCANRQRRRLFVERYGHLVVPFVGVAAFSLGAAAVIFPKPHYMVIPGVFWLITGALAASVVLPPWRPSSRRTAVTLAVLGVAAVPTPFSVVRIEKGPTGIGTEVRVVRPVTDTVHQIRSLGLAPPVHVLTFTDGFGALLGEGFEEIKIWRKGDRSLEDYIREKHVDAIVTMERGRNSFLTNDPLWTTIETQPEKAGFTRLPTADPWMVRVYLRNGVERRPEGSSTAGEKGSEPER